MFQTLLASDVPSPQRSRPALIAALLHVLVIAVAVRVTASTPPKAGPLPTDTVRLELRPAAPVSEIAPERQLIPQPPRSPELLTPLAVPRISIDPRTPLGADPLKVLERLTAKGNVGQERGRSEPAQDSILSPSEVDDPPSMLGHGQPHYPEELRTAGVTGVVRLEYVIRADGRVDSASVRVLASTHPAFSASATEFLMRASFKPARRKGLAVPARVQQIIRFQKR